MVAKKTKTKITYTKDEVRAMVADALSSMCDKLEDPSLAVASLLAMHYLDQLLK